jgi:spermidine synthase
MSKLFLAPVYFFIFITGAAGLIYEVTWQKYLSRILGSESVATAVILAAFLGGLSGGYYLCGKLTTKVRNHFKAYALLEGSCRLGDFLSDDL